MFDHMRWWGYSLVQRFGTSEGKANKQWKQAEWWEASSNQLQGRKQLFHIIVTPSSAGATCAIASVALSEEPNPRNPFPAPWYVQINMFFLWCSLLSLHYDVSMFLIKLEFAVAAPCPWGVHCTANLLSAAQHPSYFKTQTTFSITNW